MKYNIKDADGNVINTIIADTEFVEANFDHYELYSAPTPSEPTAEQAARSWRNQELADSDWIVPVSDYPQHSAYSAYRTALRDWPASEDFPDVRPQLENN